MKLFGVMVRVGVGFRVRVGVRVSVRTGARVGMAERKGISMACIDQRQYIYVYINTNLILDQHESIFRSTQLYF